MIYLKTKDQINKMIDAGKILISVHHALRDKVKEGVTTMELNDFVDDFIVSQGAYPEQKGYEGFPYAICASVNDEICHGFPSDDVVLKDGDIISIDMVVNYKGWMADSCWSYAVGKLSEEDQKLFDHTREAMYKAISIVDENVRVGEIGKCIEAFTRPKGYSIVKEFIGHGIGKNMHEDPQVFHYNAGVKGPRIVKGMAFTIEPMICMGSAAMKLDKNGWTARTKDGSKCVQFEHTLALTDNGVIITTDQGDV